MSVAPPNLRSATLDLASVREQFPILATAAHGKRLVYLDNGATTQKPRVVIDAISKYYESENANIHRGVYHLSQLATERYEQARQAVRQFINAADDREIIFTRGTTEGINLVAHSFCQAFVERDDQILVSTIEHHANIVPWQLEAGLRGAAVRPIPVNDRGEIIVEEVHHLLARGKTKLVAITHVSNSLGTVNDVASLVRAAHAVGAKVLIDGAQWVAHYPTNVRAIDADFYVFSGHKLYGPTGIGVLYGKRALLEAMPPYQSGGDMIASVSFKQTTFAELPNKFEAGTPDIAGAVGLEAAIQFLQSIGMDRIAQHEDELGHYLNQEIAAIDGVRVIGTAARKAGICSFVIEDPAMSAHDIGVLLDLENIAVRTGHHCCQPAMERMNVSATIRASVALYNTKAEVDVLTRVLRKIIADERKAVVVPQRADVELRYPPAAAKSVQASADELVETFEFLGDREARTQYLLDLGEKIPAMPALLKNDSTRVHGCMSVVHLFGRFDEKQKTIEFVADSDAHLVRGLIALLQKLFSNQRASDVLTFDIEAFLRLIQLDQFISTQRRNGLAGMIQKIRALALETPE